MSEHSLFALFAYQQRPLRDEQIKQQEKKGNQKKLKFNAIKLCEAVDVSKFNFLQKGLAAKSLRFGSRTIVQRLKAGVRATITMDDSQYSCHIYIKRSGLAACAITSIDYPDKVALAVCSQVLFVYRKNGDKSATIKEDNAESFPELDALLKQFQNPANSSKIARVQAQVDEIKTSMQANIDQLLENGERMEDLMDMAEDLDNKSKVFLKSTEKLDKKCCVVS